MKTLLVLATGLLLGAPTIVRADDAKRPAETSGIKDARLVPTMRDGVPVGMKVYAIRAGGRFDQPEAKFNNGDVIETVDGVSVTTEAGGAALRDKVVGGKADAVVVVRRKGELVTLTSKAVKQSPDR